MGDIIREYNRYILDNISDSVTGAILTMDYTKSKVNDGKGFSAYYTVTTDATASHRSGLYIKTPATTPLIYGIASFAASAAAVFAICEAPTIAANVGTHTEHPINAYRDSATTSGVFNNATTPAAGHFTTLTEAQIAADGTWATGTIIRTEPLVAGASPIYTQRYTLKANTKYVFLITNTPDTANTHYIQLDWYEE